MTRPLDAAELAAKFELHDPAIGIQEFHAINPEYGVTPRERVVGHVRSIRRLPVTVPHAS